MNRAWLHWLHASWSSLESGQSVSVPAGLIHPSKAGFQRPPLAEPTGQKDDWVLSMEDGSRVHIHEFENEKLVARRDPTDPARGPAYGLWHWLTESTSGRFALGLTTIAGAIHLATTKKPRR